MKISVPGNVSATGFADFTALANALGVSAVAYFFDTNTDHFLVYAFVSSGRSVLKINVPDSLTDENDVTTAFASAIELSVPLEIEEAIEDTET